MKEQLLSGSKTMAAHSYDEALAIIQQLTAKEQLKLIEEIVSGLQQKIEDPPLQANKEAVQPETEEQSLQVSEEATQSEIVEPSLHSIMEFEGLGKEVWEGIDVEEYLNEERNSWDR